MSRLRLLPLLLTTRIGRHRLRQYALWRLRGFNRRLSSLRRKTLPDRCRIVAVTGTYGKSTTTRLAEACLGLDPPEVPRPNSPGQVYAWFCRQWPAPEHIVIETGIKKLGQMAQVASILRPHVAIVTSIGREHSRTFETPEVTRSQKLQLLRHLVPGGVAVINADDPHVRWMGSQYAGQVVSVSTRGPANYRASEIRRLPNGRTTFRLVTKTSWMPVDLPLMGEHNVRCALLALAATGVLGIDLTEAVRNLATVRPTRSRLQLVQLPEDIQVLKDEFKSGEETIFAALEAVESLPARRKVVVLEAIDEPSRPIRRIHRAVGIRIAEVADVLVSVGPSGKMFRKGALQGGMPAEHIHVLPGLGRIVETVKALVQPGDLVLVKGRRTSHLERIALSLAGHRVECRAQHCKVPLLDCDDCPALAGHAREQRVIN